MLFDHLKKPAVVAVSLALAVGIAPMAAFAAEGDLGDVELATQEDTVDTVTGMTPLNIDSVTVTVTPPTAGDTTATDPTVSIPDGSNYSIGQAFWSANAGGTKIGSTEDYPNVTFEEGQDYLIYTSLVPKEGYAFKTGDDGTSIQVIGGALVGGMPDDNDYLYTVSSVVAKAATAATDEEPAPATEPAATDGPAATDEPAAAADTKPAAADSGDDATATATASTGSTLPKTADTLPITLLGTIALMSALVLAMAWRLRKN